MTTTTATPTTYRIISKAGADYGTYEGASPADALAAMFQDAGYDVIAAGPEGGRHLVWADPEDEAIAGGLDGWTIEAVEPEGEPSEDAIRELCILTTLREGSHFTRWSSHWQELERLGLVAVHRPVHGATGYTYGPLDWTVHVTAAGHELVDAHPELHPDANPGPWDDDPCVYAGCRYGTPALALEAAWKDYLTAGGMNSPDYALEAIGGGAERLVAEAHEDGWTWPGTPSMDDHRAAIAAVAESIRSEAS